MNDQSEAVRIKAEIASFYRESTPTGTTGDISSVGMSRICTKAAALLRKTARGMVVPDQCPLDESADVQEFAAWWMTEKPFNPPQVGATRFVGDISGVTLYRERQFQVQLFIGRPHATAPMHSHPNVDSIEIPFAGLALFQCARSEFFRGEWDTHILPNVHVAPHEMHDAQVCSQGGAFISIQKWLNGVPPSSVELDWDGAPIDAHHAAAIST